MGFENTESRQESLESTLRRNLSSAEIFFSNLVLPSSTGNAESFSSKVSAWLIFRANSRASSSRSSMSLATEKKERAAGHQQQHVVATMPDGRITTTVKSTTAFKKWSL